MERGQFWVVPAMPAGAGGVLRRYWAIYGNPANRLEVMPVLLRVYPRVCRMWATRSASWN